MNSERILFVGKTEQIDRPYNDPSTRYRCFNIAHALKNRGHDTAVVSLNYFVNNISIADNYNHIVFHRPFLNEEVFIRFLHENQDKKNLIADYDDLIFDVNNILNLPEIKTRDPYIRGTASYIARNAAACRFFKKFSVSTSALADKLQDLFPDIYVKIISNSLSSEYIDLSRKIVSSQKEKKYKIGYFPGTASHNNDFNEIAPFIEKFLNKNKKDKLFILGPLKIPSSLNRFSHRIDHISELVPFNHLPYIKANVETIIAPLGINEFNMCKSGLKFFEAMPLGCRVIATVIPDIDRFDSIYLDKCYHINDWSQLLNDKELNQTVYNMELEKMLLQVGADNVAQIWEESFLV